MGNGLNLIDMLVDAHRSEAFHFGEGEGEENWHAVLVASPVLPLLKISASPVMRAGSFHVAMMRLSPPKVIFVVAAAVVRVLGPKMAEIPFMATRECFRRRGFCRTLTRVCVSTGEGATARVIPAANPQAPIQPVFRSWSRCCATSELSGSLWRWRTSVCERGPRSWATHSSGEGRAWLPESLAALQAVLGTSITGHLSMQAGRVRGTGRRHRDARR